MQVFGVSLYCMIVSLMFPPKTMTPTAASSQLAGPVITLTPALTLHPYPTLKYPSKPLPLTRVKTLSKGPDFLTLTLYPSVKPFTTLEGFHVKEGH